MSCERYRALISANLDGDLTPDERAVLYQHLRECRDCAALLTNYRQQRAWLRELGPVEPPPTLRAAVMTEAAGRPARRAGWVGAARGLAAALVVGLLITWPLARLAASEGGLAAGLARLIDPSVVEAPTPTPAIAVLPVEVPVTVTPPPTPSAVPSATATAAPAAPTATPVPRPSPPPEPTATIPPAPPTAAPAPPTATLAVPPVAPVPVPTATPTSRPIAAVAPTTTPTPRPPASPTARPASSPAPTAPPTKPPVASATTVTPTATPTPAPSGTPPSSGTPAPSATAAPSGSPVPSGTPAPSATATATRPPAPVVVGGFARVYNDNPTVRARLGLALQNERVPEALTQPFERGGMEWVADGRQIYVLYGESRTWARFADTWSPDEVSVPGDPPPAGLFRPSRGFGKLWRENATVRERLGWATAVEQSFTGRLQRFERGLMLRSAPSGTIYVLYEDGAWQRFDDQ